jgi:hypothetical protein
LSALLLDLDNTLVPYGDHGEPPPALQEWLKQLRGAGLSAYLVSNAKPSRVHYWSERLGLPGLGLAAKPWLGFRRALRRWKLQPAQVAVIGDQLFTDVLGGNLVGAHTVLVSPLSKQELGYTRLVRRLERWVLGRLARLGQ